MNIDVVINKHPVEHSLVNLLLPLQQLHGLHTLTPRNPIILTAVMAFFSELLEQKPEAA
jgi:hypothetical protein